MRRLELGDPLADIVLIQMVDDHDLAVIENEVNMIRKYTKDSFRLVAIKVDSWNRDLSPWQAPAVFGSEGFGDGAAQTLEEVLKVCEDCSKKYYIGGYSLAGLFALWAAYQTDTFRGVAAASPSIWFPGFSDYMKAHELRTGAVYLSLGDKEERSRNSVLCTVGDKIREAQEWLREHRIPSILEWNQGNHFKDADIRTAKAFAWVIKNS